MISSPIRWSPGLGAGVITLARRVGSGLRAQLLDHPFTIDRFDASAATLWPVNPEEDEPPRWGFDLPKQHIGRIHVHTSDRERSMLDPLSASQPAESGR